MNKENQADSNIKPEPKNITTSLAMRLISLVLATSMVLSACNSSDAEAPAPGSVAASVQPDTPEASIRPTDCTRSSWVAGSVSWCAGALIYRDYVYDDYGADLGLLNLTTRLGARGNPLATTPGLLSPTAGDVTYPAGKRNTADLVWLSLRLDGSDLVIEAELNTVFAANDALLEVVLDTDDNPQTGGGRWTALSVASQGWDRAYVLRTADPDTNRLQARVPRPEGSVWRVQAAVGQSDGRVMNVAFRGTQEGASAGGSLNQVLPASGNFWEDRQASVLARGDITVFGQRVEVAELLAGVTREAPLPTGFHQRVYTSAFPLGEGIAFTGLPNRADAASGLCDQAFTYLGRYQPYGMYVPTRLTPETENVPVQLVLHGCEANHASQINQPGMQARFGEGLNRILVSPLGRGPYGFYSGPSERDVLDVLADVEATYRVDPDRVFVSGYSMGGFGAMYLASSYPDRFAGLVNWVGASGSLLNLPQTNTPLDGLLTGVLRGAVAPLLRPVVGSVLDQAPGYPNVIEYLGNLRQVPGAYLYSGLDELVQVNQALAVAQQLERVEVPYQFFLHPVFEHLSFLLTDDWRKEARASQDWVRQKNPSRVTYRFDPTFDYPEFGLVHDRAYWVSGLRSATGGVAELDLQAPGCANRSVPVVETTPTSGIDPVPWVGTQRRVTGQAPVASQAMLSGRLQGVAAARLDLSAVCLANRALTVDIVSDGPAVLTLSDGRVLALQAGNNQFTR